MVKKKKSHFLVEWHSLSYSVKVFHTHRSSLEILDVLSTWIVLELHSRDLRTFAIGYYGTLSPGCKSPGENSIWGSSQTCSGGRHCVRSSLFVFELFPAFKCGVLVKEVGYYSTLSPGCKKFRRRFNLFPVRHLLLVTFAQVHIGKGDCVVKIGRESKLSLLPNTEKKKKWWILRY
ncbi:hypothetical protein CEXT_459931 [Caerostris extrusa]|uniref:Uncharacterized protein n=1 Tax=Caerostris extrusa TaxID=172846 RepID=A0AAV4X5Y7_CAEEX|nr:hypothetical protein CEXT_459931 [Caerostris extrusa]